MSSINIKVPPPLSATDRSSFAFKTMRERLPVIVIKTIDFIHRHRRDLHKYLLNFERPTEIESKEIGADASAFISCLTKLRKELETNKQTDLLEPIDLEPELQYFNDDIELWNKALQENKLADGSLPKYFESPWLLVECYLYRKIKVAALQSRHLKMFDPFVEQKHAALRAAHNQMAVIANHLLEVEKQIAQSASNTHPSERSEFNLFVKLALWANKCDLSISAMCADKVPTQNLATLSDLQKSLDQFEPNILCDNLSELWFKVQYIKEQVRNGLHDGGPTIYVDLVADNSGYELFVDFCLIHMFSLIFCGTHQASNLKFRIHLKRMPWFVSDAVDQDVDWLLTTMKGPESGHSIQALATKWREFISSDSWHLYDHKFWTLPYDYSQMSSNCEDLHSSLCKLRLIIFKGDLNYRKLVGDRKWHMLTPFRDALRGFLPAPLVTLRTIKADVVVGIEDVNIYSKITNNELPSDWMISGNYGLVQFIEPL